MIKLNNSNSISLINQDNLDNTGLTTRRLIDEDSKKIIQENKNKSKIRNKSKIFENDKTENKSKENYLNTKSKNYEFHKLEIINNFVIKKNRNTEKSYMFSGFDIWCILICPNRFRSKTLSSKLNIFQSLDGYLDRRFECCSFMNIYEEQKQIKNIIFDDYQKIAFNYVIKDHNDLVIDENTIKEEISKKIYDFNEHFNSVKVKDKLNENIFKYMDPSLKKLLEK